MSNFMHVLRGLILVFIAIFIVSCNNKKTVVSLIISGEKSWNIAFFEASKLHFSYKYKTLYIELSKKERERFHSFVKEYKGKIVDVGINDRLVCSIPISDDDICDGKFCCQSEKIDKPMVDFLKTLGMDTDAPPPTPNGRESVGRPYP